MQTFLPYPSFSASAKCLDRMRLGKQRVEAWQIYQALENETSEWRNHPAVKMWRGYEGALLLYGSSICKEWKNRGYKDVMLSWFENELSVHNSHYYIPSFIGDEAFHASHRSNLLRKYPEWYSQFGWAEPNNLIYVWPVP